jgi:hypothetical protein
MSCSRLSHRLGCCLAGILAIAGCAGDTPDGDANGSLGMQLNELMDEFIIDGEFEVQPYVLPDGQGYRHIASTISEARSELIIFGGLGNGGPRPPTPMNENVYTLDLTKSSAEQEWEERNSDDVVSAPWFTSTRGFIEINDQYYLACDDSDENSVYAFDPETYEFEHLSTSSLDPESNAGDCCAVGITILNSRDHNQNKEERIYILGGRNDFQNPTSEVRYYSITFDKWERAEDLNVGRSHLGCVSAERKGVPLIYAIAGGNSPEGTALRSIEIYDVIKDEWTLYDDYFPEGRGRTRVGVQNIDDKYLLLVGGDSTCAGGGPNLCASDQPVTWVDLVDIKNNNRLISDEDLIPQLKFPRQTPATSLRKRKGNNQQPKYELYVVGGRTRGEEGLDVLTSTEVLSFHRIQVQNLH